MRTVTKAHIAVLLTNLFFGINYSLVKYISPSWMGPYALNLCRVSVSFLLFWMVWIVTKIILPAKAGPAGIRKEHWMRFFLCGLTGITINQLLFIQGLTMTSTIHASLLTLCTPLLITIFAFWVLKEKVTALKITGLVLGIGGAVLLIVSKEAKGSGASSLTGDIYIVLNAITYTVYFILVKPLMKIYTPLQVMRWVFTFGFAMMLPVCWHSFSLVNWQEGITAQWLSISFIVLAGTFLAYLFNVYGLHYIGAGATGSYIYTQPVFVALIATLVLHESFTLEKILAGCMIFGGVFLVSRKSGSD